MIFKVSTGFPCHTIKDASVLLFMFDVIKHNVPDDLASLFTLKFAVDLHEGEANLLFHVSNMKLANNLFNIEDQQFGHFLID